MVICAIFAGFSSVSHEQHLWAVSKHISRVNHTSDFQNRPPRGMAAGRPPRRASFCISMQPPGPLGGVGVGAWQKSRRCGCPLKCVLTPPLYLIIFGAWKLIMHPFWMHFSALWPWNHLKRCRELLTRRSCTLHALNSLLLPRDLTIAFAV
jgi:hypothetical protein